jgi:hypothetical protein
MISDCLIVGSEHTKLDPIDHTIIFGLVLIASEAPKSLSIMGLQFLLQGDNSFYS